MKWTKKIARPELEADGGKPSTKLRGNVKEVRKLFEKFKKKINWGKWNGKGGNFGIILEIPNSVALISAILLPNHTHPSSYT